MYLFDTSQVAWQVRPGEPGFTLWPALAAGNQFETDEGGSNYFVSSNAVFDDANGDAEEIIVWALSNTASLNSATPSLSLNRTIVPSLRYAVPANSVQKEGPYPLGECLNDRAHSIGPGSNVSASIRRQGILAVAGESLAYPTLGVTTSGRGVIGFTRVGETLHPSIGYASIDDIGGVGPVHMIRAGQSTQDGFTEYPPIGGNRPRWGDYGAAAVDGNNVYLAGQYIEQPPCTLAQYISTNFTCFGYRSSLANWSHA